MTDCNPARSPLLSGFRPIPASEEKHQAARHRAYPQAVAILYASTVTRPDLSQAAGVLSHESRWTAAKHLLRYIRGTSDLCLTFTAESGDRIALGFADADWCGDLDTRRSTTGYVFKVYGGTVAWKSRRQPTVALSKVGHKGHWSQTTKSPFGSKACVCMMIYRKPSCSTLWG